MTKKIRLEPFQALRLRVDSRHTVASTRLPCPELRHVSRFHHHMPGEHVEGLGLYRHVPGGHAERHEPSVHAGRNLLELEYGTHNSAGAAHTASARTTRLTAGAEDMYSTTGAGTAWTTGT